MEAPGGLLLAIGSSNSYSKTASAFFTGVAGGEILPNEALTEIMRGLVASEICRCYLFYYLFG
jgi:hypothetical protein